MGILNIDEEALDRAVEDAFFLRHTFRGIVSTALVIDPEGKHSIASLGETEGIYSKYLDLATVTPGDYARFIKHITEFDYAGLILDNIDWIPQGDDKEWWEEFVRMALKREDEVSVSEEGTVMSFDTLHIAARCKSFPSYLDGTSLHTVIIEIK